MRNPVSDRHLGIPLRATKTMMQLLDTLDVGACLLDFNDNTLCWNNTFLRLFPEHDGHIHEDEPYTANLRRFYLSRLDETEIIHIEKYIADGVTRHREQNLPFEFCHHDRWVRVAARSIPGVGRMRIWTPIASPTNGETLARVLVHGGKTTALGSIDDIADGLMVRGEDGRILSVNHRFEMIYRIEPGVPVVGLTYPELLTRLCGEQAGPTLVALADNERFAGAPFELQLANDRWVRVSERRAVDGTGVSTHVDITELQRLQHVTLAAQHRAEELAASLREQINERKRAEAALRQAQRAEAIGQLTGGVAHDFNNLLSVMLGNLDMLERDETDLPRRNRLGVVRAAGERGAALTAQLLAFSRRQPLQPQPVRLSAMVADMLPLLRSACGSRVDVQVRLPRSLPAALVDPTQLELVVLNLAINARDAMPTGGRLTISGNVRLLTAAAGDDSPAPGCYVALSVVDTGTGMAPDVMARAFEPFFTTKPPGAGSGLGLSQAFGVARQSGGTVTIDTVPGEGTQVHILLPCAVEPVAAPKSVDGSETRAVSWQILLVDDDPAVLETFEQMLRQEGHCVKAVSGAAPALAALDNGMVVDILITDVMMPGTTGPQLARMVWKRWPELPVMFISGFADPAMLVDLGRRTRLVPKPCRMKDILSAIADLLEGKAEAAEARLPQACAVG